MKTNIISVMLTLAAVAAMVLAAATTTSVLTFAGGQKPSAANELAGTSWKLVKFQGGDETTLVPDERIEVHHHVWQQRPGISASRLQPWQQHLEIEPRE